MSKLLRLTPSIIVKPDFASFAISLTHMPLDLAPASLASRTTHQSPLALIGSERHDMTRRQTWLCQTRHSFTWSPLS